MLEKVHRTQGRSIALWKVSTCKNVIVRNVEAKSLEYFNLTLDNVHWKECC